MKLPIASVKLLALLFFLRVDSAKLLDCPLENAGECGKLERCLLTPYGRRLHFKSVDSLKGCAELLPEKPVHVDKTTDEG